MTQPRTGLTRREFLAAAGAAGFGALVASSRIAWALDALDNPLARYPDRDWERALLALLLWTPGRKREAGGEDTDDEGEEREPTERDLLEERKRELMEQIRELDVRHEEGTLGEASWKRKRAALKDQTVAVMKEMEELED